MEFLSSLEIGLMPAEFAYALLACLLAYIVLGVAGFGSSLVLVVTLVQILPLQEVVAQVVFLDLFGALYLGMKNFNDIDKKEFSWLSLFNLIGLIIGLTLLINAPERPLLAVLAAFVFFNGFSMVLSRNALQPKPCRQPAGIIGGIFSSIFGTGGPIFVIYLSRRLNSFKKVRATVATIIFTTVFARAIGLAFAGLLITGENVSRSLALIPICYFGLQLGSRIQKHITASGFKSIFGVMLIVAALALLPRIIN
jgi:uncharacterized membrane protein YfcA